MVEKSRHENQSEAATRLLSHQLAFLEKEIDILQSKIGGTVSNLWTIRTLSLTIWSGAVALGLGAISSDAPTILPLLIISCLVPIWFSVIDATYNGWYHRFLMREEAIQDFINETGFQGDVGGAVNLKDSLTAGRIEFPVFDISGSHTYAQDPQFFWRSCVLGNIFDLRPFSIYATQLVTSTILCTIKTDGDWKLVFLPTASLLILGTAVAALTVRRRTFRRMKNA